MSASVSAFTLTTVHRFETEEHDKQALTKQFDSKPTRISLGHGAVTLMTDERVLVAAVLVFPTLVWMCGHTALVIVWVAEVPVPEGALGLVGPRPRHPVQTDPGFSVVRYHVGDLHILLTALDHGQVRVVLSAVVPGRSPRFGSFYQMIGLPVLFCNCNRRKRSQLMKHISVFSVQ